MEHPFYKNTFQGKSEWKAKHQDVLVNKRDNGDNSVHITEDEDGFVSV
jgi:hypothetical protein